jgi:hypothetical protein
MVVAVLTSLVTTLLGIFVGGEGGEGVLVLARPRTVLLLLPFCRLPRRHRVATVSQVMRPLLHRRRPPLGRHELPG